MSTFFLIIVLVWLIAFFVNSAIIGKPAPYSATGTSPTKHTTKLTVVFVMGPFWSIAVLLLCLRLKG